MPIIQQNKPARGISGATMVRRVSEFTISGFRSEYSGSAYSYPTAIPSLKMSNDASTVMECYTYTGTLSGPSNNYYLTLSSTVVNTILTNINEEYTDSDFIVPVGFTGSLIFGAGFVASNGTATNNVLCTSGGIYPEIKFNFVNGHFTEATWESASQTFRVYNRGSNPATAYMYFVPKDIE